MSNLRLTHRWLPAAVLLAYWGLLFLGTHVPLAASHYHLHLSDKLVHLAAYTGLALLLYWVVGGLSLLPRRTLFQLFLILAAYGLVDELTQIPIAGRSCDVLDWTADLVGIVLGLAACVALARIMSPVGHEPVS